MIQTEKNRKKRTNTIPLILAGVVFSFIFALTVVAAGIAPTDVIDMANNARVKANLPALTENGALSKAAENKANDMIRDDYFAHTSPKGVEPWYWIKQSGYQYKAAGENLAINYTSAGEQHTAWMKSTTHRANILNTRYQEIGVAVVSGKINGKDALVTVEFFGAPLYAVVDAVTPVSPVVSEVTLPAIQGVESPFIQAETRAVPLVSITHQPPVLTWFDIVWLVTAVFLGFSLVSPSLLMLYRMYQHVRLGIKARQSEVSPTTDKIQIQHVELPSHT